MTLVDTTPELILSPPANLRDLGGIAIDGGVLRTGFAVRSDDLALTDAASAQQLVDGGLTAIIDLRSVDEFAVTGRGPFGALPVAYHHVPLVVSIGHTTRLAADGGTGGLDGEADLSTMLDQSRFESMYIRIVEGSAGQIVAALGVLAHSPGAVAFHCAAGQDRTGVLAASLLLALGARPDDIVADYVATGANSTAIMARTRQVVGPLIARWGLDLDDAVRAAARAEFSPAPMRGLLQHLETSYADPLQPLRDAGLTDGLIQRLRERASAA